jgi:DNA-binding response OmpR family regulator
VEGRSSRPQADKALICGKLLLRPDVSRAYWNDVDLGLTFGEYNIVYLLASHVGQYATYRAVYDRMHHEGFLAGTGAEAIGRMCGPPSSVSEASFAPSTRRSM